MSDFQVFIDSIVSNSNGEIEYKFQPEFLEMKDKDSRRPLHYACRYGRVGLVKLLFNHGEVDSFTKEHQEINLVCRNDQIDTVKISITRKYDVNAHDKIEECRSKLSEGANCHIDVVKILIANKCDINAADIWGYHPIHLACQNGHIDIVKILIANKCNINASDEYGYQPIHLACWNGNIDIVEILIANKCDINASNEWGYQPIHFACWNGHIDIVKILIANQCDINVADKIIRYQPVHLATLYGHINIVKILIENKCDINAADKFYGYQPIHWACENDFIDVVKILIANKCDINAADKFNGYQPIHWACKNGLIDIVKLLIANKCDINAANKNGYQPIHLACWHGHFDIVEILIANKCKTHKLSKKGESPISIATQRGHQRIVDILFNANPIESIAVAMDLQKCKIDCDHSFCRQSLENETFKKGESIGSGSFGKVYKYKISNTDREIVIKRTKSICEDTKNIEGNINKYSSRILHKNIVRYFGALEKSGKLCIYMEYIPGGSLRNLIDKTKWIEHSKVIKFCKEILDGLQFIHRQGIIHRDIKPDNMLLDLDETLKLADFGLSISLRNVSILETTAKAKTFCGTPHYLAPEIFLGQQYDFPADIWSTGASIIHMITGKMPYHTLAPEAVMFRIGTLKKIEFISCQPISETMESFINDLLKPEQLKRPKIDSLLKHSLFKDMK